MAAFSLQGPPSPPPSRLPVQAWVPSTGRPTTSLSVLWFCVCICVALLLHNHRTDPEGYRHHTESPHFGSRRPVFTSVSAIGFAEIQIRQRVSPLRLFLVVCPHGLLCLDTLTTRSCEVTAFQPAASLSESQLFSYSLSLCRFDTAAFRMCSFCHFT